MSSVEKMAVTQFDERTNTKNEISTRRNDIGSIRFEFDFCN